MALGWPVSEKGPEPGRQILPVARWRLHTALVFQVPKTLWFSPMVHSVIHSSASPIRRAARRMSASGRPVVAATADGAKSSSNADSASQPSVWAAMKPRSTWPASRSRCRSPFSRATSVPGRI